MVAQTRAGKQVLNVGDGAARVCRPAAGDHVAAIGENRKLLVFPLDELPEMARGKGVRLQSYKDGGLSDAIVFALAHGLSWTRRRRRPNAHDGEADLRQGYCCAAPPPAGWRPRASRGTTGSPEAAAPPPASGRRPRGACPGDGPGPGRRARERRARAGAA